MPEPRVLAHVLGLRTLVDVGDLEVPEVEIIAIHGLGGHPTESWTYTESPSEPQQVIKPTEKAHRSSRGNTETPVTANIIEAPNFPQRPASPPTQTPVDPMQTLWLSDLLPASKLAIPGVDSKIHPLLQGGVKKARIRTFGYDSTRAAKEGKTLYGGFIHPVAMELLKAVNGGYSWERSREDPEKYDKVPLVFVAMDIGGSIVKEALTISATTRAYHNVLFRTQLLLFFSVPSNPNPPTTTFADLLLDISLSSLGAPENRPHRHALLAAAIKSDAERTLEGIESTFSLINPGIYRTVSIFATAPTAWVINTVVVPEENAVLGGHGGAGGHGWGGPEVKIPRLGKDHLTVGRFSRRDPGDLEIIGRIAGLVHEVVQAWDMHAGWGAGRNPSHYLALRKEFTPVNGDVYGPLPMSAIIQDNRTGAEGIPEYEKGCQWVLEYHGFRLWREHGSGRKFEESKKQKKVAASTDEATEILGDIAPVTEPKGGAVLHIYGQPGTGKTTLAKYLVQQFLREANGARTHPAVPPPPSEPAPITTSTEFITRPIILAFTPAQTHHLPTPHFPTAKSTHNSADIIATLISQYLIQDSTSAHTLHRLRRAISKRRKGSRWWEGWSDEDMWLLFDEMLAAREERSVIIVIDDDFQHLRKQHATGRSATWVLQRLVDRVASGGPEGNGLVKLIVTTRHAEDITGHPECQAVGYLYNSISLDIDPMEDVTSPQLAARNAVVTAWIPKILSSLGNPWARTLQHVGEKLLQSSGVAWLDLQLALTLAPRCISQLLSWLECRPKVETVDIKEDLGCGGWGLRKKLYELHYDTLLASFPGKQSCVRLALGWLLYTPTPMRLGALAMAIAMRDQPLAFQEGIGVQDGENKNASEGTKDEERDEGKKLSVFEEHPDFLEIVAFLRNGLGGSQFVHVLLPGKAGLEATDAEYTRTGGEFVGLRHGEVRNFLLGLSQAKGQEGSADDSRAALPAFADKAAWSEYMALTCFKAMYMPGRDLILFPGQGLDYWNGVDVEPEVDVFQEEYYTIPGADEWGEKIVEEGANAKEQAEMDSVTINEQPETENPGTMEYNDIEVEKEDAMDENEEEEIIIIDGQSEDWEGEAVEALSASEDIADVISIQTDAPDGNVPTTTTEEDPDLVGVGSKVPHTCYEDGDANAEEDETPTTQTSGPIHPATCALILYAITNWVIHVQTYYALTHPESREDVTPLPKSALTTNIINFMTPSAEDLSWWRDHFSFLRTTTSTTYPLSTKLTENPLQLSAHFGFLPLVKHFSTSLPKEERTLKIKIMAMEAAAGSGSLECFKYLFYLHSDFEFPAMYFVSAAVRAIKSGALDVVGELLKGKCAEMVKKLLCDAPQIHWGYADLVRISAEFGQREIMELLLDEMPDSVYEACLFLPIEGQKKKKKAHSEDDTGNQQDDGKEENERANNNGQENEQKGKKVDLDGSPIHYACRSGFTDNVKHLLQRTAANFPPIDPSTADRNGFTPLYHAVRKGHLRVAQLLLSHSAVDADASGCAIQPLHLGAEKGYHSIVEELLRRKANPDATDSDNRTPLHLACIDGYPRVVRLLLRQGVDANSKDKDGFTPLHLAATRGKLEVVELLVQNGADPDATFTATGSTPLHYAVTKGFLNLVRKLLEAGAAVDSKLKDFEYTPLHLAAFYGYLDICQLLLEHGADVSLTTKPNPGLFWRAQDWNLLQLCWGNIELTRMFIDAGGEVNYLDRQNNSPLVINMTADKYESAKLLIDAGADVNNCGKNSDIGQPLYLALKHNRPAIEMVKVLLDRGADVNTISAPDIWTPLYKAIFEGSQELVKLLCEHGADVEKTATPNCTWRPLHAAARNGVNEIVDLLLHYKADPNSLTDDERLYTPVYLAAGRGHTEVVRTLLANGAKTSLPNQEGRYEYTALTTAAQGGYIEIIKLLLQKGVDVDQISGGEDGFTALYMACANNHPDCARLLLEVGKAAPDIVTVKQGWTALHAASQGGYTDCVKLLLEHGNVNVNSLTKDSKSTALWYAAEYGHIEIVKLLLAHGADPCIISDDGLSTPLYTATRKGHTAIVRVLLEHGATVAVINELHDRNGDKTALLAACELRNAGLVRMLLDHGADPTKRREPPTTNIRDCLNCASVDGYTDIVRILLTDERQVERINALSGPNKTTALVAGAEYVEIVNMLLEKGADVTIPNMHNSSIAHICVEGGHIETLKKLISLKVSLGGVNDGGETPVYCAVQKDQVEALKLLLSAGASPLAVPHPAHGWSPLQSAASAGKMDIARILLAEPAVLADIDYRAMDHGRGATALYQAVMAGHVDMMKLLTEHGANVNTSTTYAWTPIISAAADGHTESVKLLLEHGADVDGHNGNTIPLYEAAKRGHLEMCKLLLEHGAIVDGRTSESSNEMYTPSPLCIATQGGHEDICKLLLERGADVNSLGNWNTTPLYEAAKACRLELCKLLLEHGANVDGRTSDSGNEMSSTPLCIATQGGHEDICKLILEHGASVDICEDKFTPLLRATHSGNAKIARMLIGHGADVNGEYAQGTPLIYAIRTAQQDIVELLLERGADVNRTANSDAPLLEACGQGKTDICKLLLQHGADVNCKDVGSPLKLAAGNGHKQICELLIEHGVKVNGKEGSTSPLADAASGGRLDICQLLIKHGADVTGLLDPSVDCPLTLAACGGNLEICKLLLDRGANVDGNVTGPEDPDDLTTPLSQAVKHGYVDIVKFFLEHGASVNLMGRSHRTPLYWATAAINSLDCVQLLLHHGAEADGCVTAPEISKGEDTLFITTPLYEAAAYHNVEICRLLLDKDAKVDFQDHNHITPLNAAAASYYKNTDCARLLLEHGADVNGLISGPLHQDGKTQRTPLYNATWFENAAMVSLLLEHNADTNFCTEDGLGALHVACQAGDDALVRILLAHPGVDPNLGNISDPPEKRPKGRKGITPLYVAAQYGRHSCVKLLLEAGFDPNSGILSDNWWNPLVEAARNGFLECLQLLVEAGGNVQYATKAGHSLLWHACKRGGAAAATYLLDQGADIDGSDPRGVPFLAAIGAGNSDIVKLLKDKGANIKAKESGFLNRGALFFAVQGSTLHSLTKDPPVPDMWDDIHARDARGRTPLFYAAARGARDIVSLLLELGADRTVKDVTGRGVLEVTFDSDEDLRKLLGADETIPVDPIEFGQIRVSGTYNCLMGVDELRECNQCRAQFRVGYFWREY